jgi:hypothetical protein
MCIDTVLGVYSKVSSSVPDDMRRVLAVKLFSIYDRPYCSRRRSQGIALILAQDGGITSYVIRSIHLSRIIFPLIFVS